MLYLQTSIINLHKYWTLQIFFSKITQIDSENNLNYNRNLYVF